ncbi:sugar transferase [Exiguobacterium sp. ZWU0009]|uniref:sugar transferase n=1 Tax=Exiguobacterium sp. ZWU0009 TaxID=1224749 RepID=UPI000903AB37|nr:sugar transferase [Exiguobacterium sp. ZWU0009]
MNETTVINQISLENIGSTSAKSILYRISKRSIDIILSLMFLSICSPIFLIFFLLIKIREPKHDVFFGQYRYGLNGKRFKMYKFRSMIANAEQKLKNNKILYQKYIDNNYKLESHEDPRITKLGAFIRKYSIDEIPQFYNVLKGDMSIVGPRPIVDEELDIEYGVDRIKFLSTKPGITGYWQANGRSNVGYPRRKKMELYYIDNCSLMLDFKIILLTIKSVIFKTGAY